MCTICFQINSEWIIIDSPSSAEGIRKTRKPPKNQRTNIEEESSPASRSSSSSISSDEEDTNADLMSDVRELAMGVGEDSVDGELCKTATLAALVVPGVDVLLQQKFDSESVEIGDVAYEDAELNKHFTSPARTTSEKPKVINVSVQDSSAADSSESERTEIAEKCIGKTTRWTEEIGETEEDDSDEENESINGEDLSTLMQVVVGLLELLQMILKYSNESTHYALLAEAIYMDQAQVMINHPHPVIRTAVFKVWIILFSKNYTSL